MENTGAKRRLECYCVKGNKDKYASRDSGGETLFISFGVHLSFFLFFFSIFFSGHETNKLSCVFPAQKCEGMNKI